MSLRRFAAEERTAITTTSGIGFKFLSIPLQRFAAEEKDRLPSLSQGSIRKTLTHFLSSLSF